MAPLALLRQWFGSRPARRAALPRQAYRPVLEVLEDRLPPGSLLVTSLPEGDVSLVEEAEQTSGLDANSWYWYDLQDNELSSIADLSVLYQVPPQYDYFLPASELLPTNPSDNYFSDATFSNAFDLSDSGGFASSDQVAAAVNTFAAMTAPVVADSTTDAPATPTYVSPTTYTQPAAPPPVENYSDRVEPIHQPVRITGISQDTGADSTDMVTNDTSLTLTGTATPYTVIYLTVPGQPMIEATSDVAGAWSATVELPDGIHLVSATSSWTTESDSVSVRVDTQAPVMQLSMPKLSLSHTPSLRVEVADDDTILMDRPIVIDVDLNGDGAFTGEGETGFASAQPQWDYYSSLYSSLPSGGFVGSASIRLPALPDGAHLVRARFSDVAGNETSRSGVIQIGLAGTESRLFFEPNVGQTGPEALFVARGRDSVLFLTPQGITAALDIPASQAYGVFGYHDYYAPQPEPTDVVQAPLSINFVGSNPGATATGLGLLSARSNYFLGDDPGAWVQDVANYGQVHYSGVYEGIDLVFSGIEGQLRYDFHVAPGADPNQIQLQAQLGALPLTPRLDPDGQLTFDFAGREFTLSAPVIYQLGPGGRELVQGRYVVGPRESGSVEFMYASTSLGQIGIEVGEYDPTRELIIDPTLVFSTFTGGNNDDVARDLALDGAGNAYVTGFSQSTNFPTTIGPPRQGQNDVVVVKFNNAGTARLYSTFVGGANDDEGRSIAVSAAGEVHVAGATDSPNFPMVSQAQTNQQNRDGFAFKLNTSGGLAYSTYIGGDANDEANGIALDGSGSAYVTGRTGSDRSATSFSIISASGVFQSNKQPQDDAYVIKLNSAGAVVYGTFLGGNADDFGSGIAVDGGGNAYIVGSTDSSNFSSAGAFQPNQPQRDAFLARLDATGNRVFATYLGGNNDDDAFDVALDPSANVYVVGETESNDLPTTAGAFQRLAQGVSGFGNRNDAFVGKFTAAGAQVYLTYLGSTGDDSARAVFVNSSGFAYVAGATDSNGFPDVQPIQPGRAGFFSNDAFVSLLSQDGSQLVFSTHFGGMGNESGRGVAVDGGANIFLAGSTDSNISFPTRNAIQATNGGQNDLYVAKIGNIGVGGGGGAIGPDALEPNDTSEKAINRGDLVTDSITAAIIHKSPALNDYDWYRWSASAAGTVTVTMTITGGGDLELKLWMLSGNTLVELGRSTAPGVRTRVVGANVVAGQPILVEIKGRNSSLGVLDQGSYTLNVALS